MMTFLLLAVPVIPMDVEEHGTADETEESDGPVGVTGQLHMNSKLTSVPK